MYPEPSVPFYMALSVYVPMLVLAFFMVYGTLRLFLCGLHRFASLWSEPGHGAHRPRGMHLPPTPGRA